MVVRLHIVHCSKIVRVSRSSPQRVASRRALRSVILTSMNVMIIVIRFLSLARIVDWRIDDWRLTAAVSLPAISYIIWLYG
jgi:hypothetical protein